ncbi:MAG: phosphoserine transaminase, partial [candidate division Zixibacteria bacterium]|nr:phosphoserine transaminase [candidate division Zixibacteria bacterium]
MTTQPSNRPHCPHFSSGPCAKRPDWTPLSLATALVGRSHRSDAGKTRIADAIDRTRRLLEIPDSFRLGVVPGSDTGAFEMALWSLLGPRAVDVLVWESFSAGWATDVTRQLPLDDVRVLKADYGDLPDLGSVSFDRDVVFVWNGTTSGAKLPNGSWIDQNRDGLTLCDATSAAFAMELPWDRLDVVTLSWQKCLGGEAGHGMLALGPRAVERLENHTPPWPLPKVFRLTKNGKLNEGIFKGVTINTPSMLCVEDWLDALLWGESQGGLNALIRKSEANLAVIAAWVEKSPDFAFLAAE